MNLSMPRVRRRSLALCVGAGALALAALIPALPASGSAKPASTVKAASGGYSNYLALGDSVAFGYVPPQAKPAPNYMDQRSFVGYPEDLAQALKLKVANASCPGETTASMLNVKALSNGCENAPGSSIGYRSVYPLHVNYSGSQEQFAINYLEHHTTKLVTIDIGANDYFLCVETTKDGCTSGKEIGNLIKEIETNLAKIYTGIRDTAHYTGPIVLVSYYSLNYADTAASGLDEALDSVLSGVTKKFGGITANGFQAFHLATRPFKGDTCAAGLLIKLPGGTCNIHPSPAGHLVLASTVAQALGANRN